MSPDAVRLSLGGARPDVDLFGWYEAEPEGRWSRAAFAEVIIPAPPGTNGVVMLELQGRVFGTAIGGPARVRLSADDGPSTEVLFGNDHFAAVRAVLRFVPAGDRPRNLRLSLVRLDPVSPAEAGESGDERKIGVFARRITFHWNWGAGGEEA
ncbi:hypothetical protein D9599_03705 [Roseomonas sp. KE2513]|uniref:hypothetical protein n=1 Tax=Roseomonas sp. KE2513 TaxID=2479202 RepID=UPI0018E02060|nr:hypothetical protein [Roseomonas sp. KE2513]MBI0534674.1 hypothetical protein [Roseomonas sp. KE2513]